MTVFTTQEVAEVISPTGTTERQLVNWCTHRHVTPTGGGSRQGKHRQFAPLKVVGIAVGAAMYKSDRGCSPEYVGAVAEAFASVTEDWLRAEFAKGHTHFVTLHQGKPLLREPQPYYLPDVKAAYDRVMAYLN